MFRSKNVQRQVVPPPPPPPPRHHRATAAPPEPAITKFARILIISREQTALKIQSLRSKITEIKGDLQTSEVNPLR